VNLIESIPQWGAALGVNRPSRADRGLVRVYLHVPVFGFVTGTYPIPQNFLDKNHQVMPVEGRRFTFAPRPFHTFLCLLTEWPIGMQVSSSDSSYG
jgi:hypothetical protein